MNYTKSYDEIVSILKEKGDFYLIRTTNEIFYDEEKDQLVLKPVCEYPLALSSDICTICSTLFGIFKRNMKLYQYSEQEYMEKIKYIKQQLKKINPLFPQYRTTLHFCINGLVASHDTNDFSGRDFIVMDKFSEHIQEDFCAFRVEDTFKKGEFYLSPSAIIKIPANRYQQVMEKYPFLIRFKDRICVFGTDTMSREELWEEGRKSVDSTLEDNGIQPIKMGTNGALEFRDEEEIRKIIYSFVESSSITYRHSDSTLRYEDSTKNYYIQKYYELKIYKKLLSSEIVLKLFDTKELDKFKSVLCHYRDMYNDEIKDNEKGEILESIITKIGIEEFKKILESYNEELLANLRPTNELIAIVDKIVNMIVDEISNSNLLVDDDFYAINFQNLFNKIISIDIEYIDIIEAFNDYIVLKTKDIVLNQNFLPPKNKK